MKWFSIFCILLFFSTFFCLADTPLVSLKKRLSACHLSDTTKVNLLNQPGYQYWITNPLQSELYGNEALNLSDCLNFIKGKSFTKPIVSVSHWTRKQYETALKYLLEGLTPYQQLNDYLGIRSMYNNTDLVYLDQHSYELALAYFEQSLEKHTLLNNDKEARVRSNIGNICLKMDEHAEAEKMNQTSIQVSTRKWLTQIYDALKKIEVAPTHYKQALAYQEGFAIRKDSLLDEEKSRQTAEMQLRYQTLQQEHKLQLQQKQLEILQQQNRIQQYLRNGLIAGLLLLAVIGYLMVSKRQLKIRKNKELLEKNKALAKAEFEKARLQELKLTLELEYKNKELASYMLNFIQKNELLEELNQNIQQLKRTQDKATASKLNDLNRMVEQSMNLDKNWEDFKRHFDEVHKGFFKALKDNYPDITSNELKLCALLKLNMNLKEASHVMGISPESVKTARYRLRKKFNLTRNENLISHILELEKKAIEGQETLGNGQKKGYQKSLSETESTL